MGTHEILVLIGIIATFVIFIISQLLANMRFKKKQDLAYVQFKTQTDLKLSEFNKELAELKAKIEINKGEIIKTYEQFKNETCRATDVFRLETIASLKDNKEDHAAINDKLTLVQADLAFIRGKLSNHSQSPGRTKA